jgi:hypothetical protein
VFDESCVSAMVAFHNVKIHPGRRFNAEFGSVIHVGEEHMAEGVVQNPAPQRPSVSTVIFARRKSMVRCACARVRARSRVRHSCTPHVDGALLAESLCFCWCRASP